MSADDDDDDGVRALDAFLIRTGVLCFAMLKDAAATHQQICRAHVSIPKFAHATNHPRRGWVLMRAKNSVEVMSLMIAWLREIL